MTSIYYHLSPVILTDNLFFGLQPQCVVTGSFVQRQAAFAIAEQQMINELSTPLLPTNITGTYMYQHEPIYLEYERVNAVNFIWGMALDNSESCDLTPYPGCAVIRDHIGLLDHRVIGRALSACGCGPGSMYQLLVGYNAGLPTGVAANDQGLHLGLAMAAAQVLKEIADPGANEGGPGAPGLTSFGAQGYSESRVSPEKTSFGENAIGTFIRGLVGHLRIHRALSL